MASTETGLPDRFDVKSGLNVKWHVPLGSQSYGTPIVSQGRVLIGTNNDRPRDPRHQGDRGVMMCLAEGDGHMLWQLVSPKMEDDPYLDWPKAGMASSPSVEGDRIYTLTNRGEVVCLSIDGLAHGNRGPYLDEARHMTPRGEPLMATGPLDADIIWMCDLVQEAGIHLHDQTEGSLLIDGNLLYVNSCNGVDNTHKVIRSPDAPSLVVLDKRTGKIVSRDGEHIGPDVFHNTWCSPSLATVNGRRTIFFGGDNGVCYAFDALDPASPTQPKLLTRQWRFDCDPTAPKQNIHSYLGNRKVSPSVIFGMPVFDNGKLYVTAGGDLWWGKHKSWIRCLDIAGAKPGDAPKELWSFAMAKETCCTPAIYNGLVFTTDCGGNVNCLDAETGNPLWSYKADGPCWASCMVADGKVFIGTRAGEFDILAAEKKLRVISSTNLGEPITATTTIANGTLYIATMRTLYAVATRAVTDAR